VTDVAPPPPAEPVVSLRGVWKSFGDRPVLQGVDLAVGEAENVVVLGRSGSGKSVLIKIVVALLAPDAGEVRVLGQDVHRLRRRDLDRLRARVGFSFQGSALYDSMDVRRNLAFPLTMNEPTLSAAEVEDRVAAALEAVGLAAAIDQMPAELSGGQRKRVGIARTLILRPRVMLYDEPTGGLDPVTSGEINDLIRQVQATHRTSAIVITHDLTCARTTGDRVAMLVDGRIHREGSFDHVFDTDDPRVRGFYDYNFIRRDPP
jgi:phospholipid/cholesterol/gamma-HCH transport system ATP-binding protein